eukprot:TRINITY_DN13609_c0_g1_i1.p2 TRINITY_DN13609_c0_g1~~TRINITY_DN13609_c0_g1_i1.p2  ORF type:complete len:192 (-),score=31.01 TRINITY_DN13609_c0_g1_i1:42-617(-)
MVWFALFCLLYSSVFANPPSEEPDQVGLIVLDTATFGAGCFWGVEKLFKEAFPLIKHTKVGYMGGKQAKPTYEDVKQGTTGHVEVLQLRYDPRQIDYKDLVEFFFRIHDPTTVDRQGNDVGSQYRSVIFYSKKSHKNIAKEVMADIQEKYYKDKPIATKIEREADFWAAEEYHQRYLEKNPEGYCNHKLHW